MKYALITGASSGFGWEFAKLAAADGFDVIVVARREEKLQELKKEIEAAHDVAVQVVVQDLSEPDAAVRLMEQVGEQEVELLFNNAGFGDYGPFVETNWGKESAMMQVNMRALTQLTKLVLPGMIERGKGRVLNVASTAAFQPGPLMAVYYATKAFVLHFSEAVAEELDGTGVTVTALCPGATRTGFESAADVGGSPLFDKNKRLPTAKDVSIYGYRAMMNGKRVAIHGTRNRLFAWSNRLAPRRVVVKVVKRIQA